MGRRRTGAPLCKLPRGSKSGQILGWWISGGSRDGTESRTREIKATAILATGDRSILATVRYCLDWVRCSNATQRGCVHEEAIVRRWLPSPDNDGLVRGYYSCCKGRMATSVCQQEMAIFILQRHYTGPISGDFGARSRNWDMASGHNVPKKRAKIHQPTPRCAPSSAPAPTQHKPYLPQVSSQGSAPSPLTSPHPTRTGGFPTHSAPALPARSPVQNRPNAPAAPSSAARYCSSIGCPPSDAI